MNFFSLIPILFGTLLLNSCFVERGKILVTQNLKKMIIINLNLLSYDNLSAYSSASNSFLTGSMSYSGIGDGVFSNPQKISIDSFNGDILVVDSLNSRIEKFTSNGLFIGSIGKSFAGGSCINGTQAGWCKGGFFTSGNTDGAFEAVQGIKVDAIRNLIYVADLTRVQKFNLSTGAFIGSIGNSSASGTCTLGSQSGWCTGGVFSSGASDGMFNSASDVDVSFTDNILIVSDSSNNRIQKFNLSTGAFIGAIGKSTATGSCVLGKQVSWCTGGTFSVGDGDGLFENPSSVAIDSSTNVLIVANYYNDSVQKFNLTTGSFIGAIGISQFSAGTCVAGKQAGWCAGGIFDYDDREGGFWRPSDVEIDSGGDLMYVSDIFSTKVQKFILSSGAYLGSIGYSTYTSGSCVSGIQSGWCFSGTHSFSNSNIDGAFSVASGVGIDLTNNKLYVSDKNNNRIQRFNLATGAFQSTLNGVLNLIASWKTVAQSGSAVSSSNNLGFSSITDHLVDKLNNHLYVSSSASVQKFNLTTGQYLGSIGKSTASGTCIAGKQNSWCTGGSFSSGLNDGEFSNVSSITADVENDLLYVATSEKIQKFILSSGAFVGAIGKSTSSGTCTLGAQATWCSGGSFSTGSSDGMFNSISSLRFDPANGFLYVVDKFNYRIQKINFSGLFIGAIGNSSNSGTCTLGAQASWCTGGFFSLASGDGKFFSPNSIAIDSSYFYVGDSYRINKFNLSDGSFIGAIGNSTATGNCTNGKQSN